MNNCNTTKAVQTTDAFNTKFWDTNADRFLDWLKWEGSKSTTGGLCSLDEYEQYITSPYWIAGKAAAQASGEWSNPSLEMFQHFLKLSALGASDTVIQSIYTTLTTRGNASPQPIDPSAFNDITPDKWESYRAYLIPGKISTGDFGISVGETFQYWQLNADYRTTAYTYRDFLKDAGYYK
ncbi:hypothetical protein VN97_g11491 [Penicillium thymicola]|uniref:Uncharacterized protein n=1 Tax=Penicillium thymicola TaxID=293382 RepID=A0AAI9T6Z9_PENTH|nr:hypothetical protein VN97_g11491 [Penicillium thymicola]